MNLCETDLVLTVWVASLNPEIAGRDGDWMFVLIRTIDGKLRAEHRFRYHNGAGFDSGDEVSRYAVEPQTDTADARKHVRRLIDQLMLTGGFENVQCVEVNGGPGAFLDALMNLPGWRIQVTKLDAPPEGT